MALDIGTIRRRRRGDVAVAARATAGRRGRPLYSCRVTDWLTATILALAGVAAVVGIVLLVRDEPAQDRTFVVLGVVEVAVLVQLVVGAVSLSQTDRDVSGVLFVSYLVGNLLVLPIGAFWSLAERTRAGTGVLLVAVVTVIALQLRLETIWDGSGA